MRGTALRPLTSEAEFLRQAESNEKTELVDGHVIVSPSPTYLHQEILGRLATELRLWASHQRRPVTVGQSPLDVRFARGRILQPDAFVLLSRIPPDHEGPINRVPELCIEVLSSGRVHDRVTKRFIYGAAGVKEYWIVDPLGVVERWTGPGLTEAAKVRMSLTSPLLPEFKVNLRKLFAGLRRR